ncbi:MULTISPECIES: hypothetical protein [unclassified Rhizobium]|nr:MULTISPECIES: hypothetical protein [unclassified Rhizobium]
MENFLALLAVAIGTGILGVGVAYAMRWQRDHQRAASPRHDIDKVF